jgi:hypothetical protein
VLAAALALALPVACERLVTNLSGGAGPEAGLLRGKTPSASRAVTHVLRLTDGIAAQPGDPWRTDLTAVLSAEGAFVTWDLGVETPVRCALVEADGDDRYTLSLSSDGQQWKPLWTAEPDEERGSQLRAGRDLEGRGRYLRLTAAGGDGRWAVAEISAWKDCPTQWPALAVQKGARTDEAVETKLWAFAVLAIGFVLLVRPRAPDWVKLLGVVPAGVGVALAVQIAEIWPLPAELGCKALGALAAVGLAAVIARRARRRPAAG